MAYLFVKIMVVVLIILVVALLVLGYMGYARIVRVSHDVRGKLFVSGTIPDPVLDGFYNGSVSTKKTSWLGKKFNATTLSGINVFSNNTGGQSEKYSFITYIGKGLTDKNLDVLKIDYNIQKNPFWVRPILDEVVQISPNEYLGKMQLRIIPNFPLSVLYFKLKK